MKVTPFPPFMCDAPFRLDLAADGSQPVAEITFYRTGFTTGGFFTGDDAFVVLNTFETLARGSLLKWWGDLGQE
jgi:hypothetical protein